MKTLEERFAPPTQIQLYKAQLREREQRPGESLPELSQDIFRLVNMIYPSAPSEMINSIAVEKFVGKLRNKEIRIRILQAKPTDLNAAVSLAVELESIYKGEKQRQESDGKLRTVNLKDLDSRDGNEKCARMGNQRMKKIEQELVRISKALSKRLK